MIEFINKYLDETKEICNSINKEEISKFTNILFNTWKNGKKVITMGNGGSSSTASHFAGDLLKTVVNDSSMKEINSAKGFKAICLNDNQPALTAWINDSGWDRAYSGLLNTLLDEGDTILLVSVHGGSGWSGNVVHAMDFAKKRGAKIIGLAGFDGGKMKEMCDSCIVVPKDSTPHTEGFHGVLQHMIVFKLKEMIDNHIKSEGAKQ
jgi:D-sedoheptulose 7-phosphate isomerase